jgi:hypothetical protein
LAITGFLSEAEAMIRGGGRVLDAALSDVARAFEEASVRARRRVTVKSENGRELRNGVGFREYSLLSRVPPVHASCGG